MSRLSLLRFKQEGRGGACATDQARRLGCGYSSADAVLGETLMADNPLGVITIVGGLFARKKQAGGGQERKRRLFTSSRVREGEGRNKLQRCSSAASATCR